MKKIIVFLFVLLVSSGCNMFLPQTQEVEISTTNNGSILFSSAEDIGKLCNKSDLDSFLAGKDPFKVFEEFSIPDQEKLTFAYNPEKFLTLTNYPTACQYRVFGIEFMVEFNYVEIKTLDLNEGEEVDLVALSDDKIFEDFINSTENTIVAQVVKYYLKEYDDEVYSSFDITAPHDGEFVLIAKPVFIQLHFADQRLIYDFDIAGITGVMFELKER